jgi:hypothetical protein
MFSASFRHGITTETRRAVAGFEEGLITIVSLRISVHILTQPHDGRANPRV